LAALGLLAHSAADAHAVALFCGITQAEALRLLGRLVTGGLAHVEHGRYSLDEAALRRLAASLPRPEPVDGALLVGIDASDADVARRFFRGRSLIEIPSAGPRRNVVLRIVVDEFLPGRYYTEAEVRRILRRFHPDDAALRRYLVDEGLLTRQDSSRTYWRGGGPPP
jgi:hypothetical protein